MGCKLSNRLIIPFVRISLWDYAAFLSVHIQPNIAHTQCAPRFPKRNAITHTQNTTKATRNQWIIQHLNKHKTRLDFGKGKNMECGKGWGRITTASTCIEIHKIKLRRSHNDEQNKVAQNFREHSTMECQEGKRKEEGGRKEEKAVGRMKEKKLSQAKWSKLNVSKQVEPTNRVSNCICACVHTREGRG